MYQNWGQKTICKLLLPSFLHQWSGISDLLGCKHVGLPSIVATPTFFFPFGWLAVGGCIGRDSERLPFV
jgi:hypothetical protein